MLCLNPAVSLASIGQHVKLTDRFFIFYHSMFICYGAGVDTFRTLRLRLPLRPLHGLHPVLASLDPLLWTRSAGRATTPARRRRRARLIHVIQTSDQTRLPPRRGAPSSDIQDVARVASGADAAWDGVGGEQLRHGDTQVSGRGLYRAHKCRGTVQEAHRRWRCVDCRVLQGMSRTCRYYACLGLWRDYDD